jgi:hypothetical protein
MARQTIAERVAALGDLSREQLMELWVKQYGVAPPLGIRQPQLLRAAAYQFQEKQLGGLSPVGKRLLKAAVKRVSQKSTNAGLNQPTPLLIADGLNATKPGGKETRTVAKPARPAAPPSNIPLPGTRLIREWNGRRYVVEVAEAGFVMDGKTYRSLTAIAFRITGTQWSGRRFFGL